MSENILNLTNGEFDEKGMLRLLGTLLTQSGVVQSGALLVAAQSTPDMSIKVGGAATGHDIVFVASDGATYHGWNTADKTVLIASNATGVTKKDAIVAYADLTAGSGDSNNPGALKFVSVRGSGTNTAPDNAQITASAVGSNPYVVLAHVTVANGASSINSGNITDQRSRAQVEADRLASIGTGQLEDDAVSTPKIADDAVTEAKLYAPLWYEEIGRSTQASAASTLTVNFTAKKYLRIIIRMTPSAASALSLRVNGDSGANYSVRFSDNGAADGTLTSQTSMRLVGANSLTKQFEIVTVNEASAEKLLSYTGSDSSPGAANAPEKFVGTGKWANTSNQITSLTLIGSSGNINAGSEIIVLGHD